MNTILYRNQLRFQEKSKDDFKENTGMCCNDQCIEKQSGDNVCLNCGMVIGRDYISSERRAYTIEEINSRKRTEPRWRNFGARTIIPKSKIDFRGKPINLAHRSLYSRLSKIQSSLLSNTERNLWEASPKMKLIAEILRIPPYIRTLAWRIYTLVVEKKFTTGRSIEGFIAASLYIAIRIHKFSRMLDEICIAARSPRKTVHSSLGIIKKNILPELGLKYQPITPELLVYKFGNDLKLPIKIQKDAISILGSASRNGLLRAGKDPKGFAACVIYMAAKKVKEYRKTQKEVVDVANITEVTLRSRSKEIKDILNPQTE